MDTYIARLTDGGSLAEPIVWRTASIAEARELLVNVGAWQTAPDGGGQILLSDAAHVVIFDDAPPFRDSDDLAERIADRTPRVGFFIGSRGGLRRMTF
jgi:hypothetical protein